MSRSGRLVCSRSGNATFSNTERSVSRAPFWNSIPMRRRRAYSASPRSFPMSSPATMTEPESATSWPVISRRSVVLPVPLGPMTAVIRPGAMSTSIPSKIERPRTAYRRLRISTMAARGFNETRNDAMSSCRAFHSGFVAAARGQTIQPGTDGELPLAARQAGHRAAPGLQSGILQRASVAEGERPRQRPRRIHQAQVQRRLGRALPPREERDAGHCRRYVALQDAHGLLGDLLGRGLLRALLPRDHHVGLEHHALENDARGVEVRKHALEHDIGHLLAALDRMIAVHQHLGLDDGHDRSFLAKRRIAGERLCVRRDRVTARDTRADIDHRTPLGESRAELVVLRKPLAQP